MTAQMHTTVKRQNIVNIAADIIISICARILRPLPLHSSSVYFVNETAVSDTHSVLYAYILF